MSSKLQTIALAAGTTLALLAAPAAAEAQQRPDVQPLGVVQVSAGAPARAAEFHNQGTMLGDSLNRLGKAARLHERSAALRNAADPQGFACLREAALLRYYDGDRRSAARLMEEAAQRAAERGDVVAASRSYSDAAIIRYELKQLAQAWDLGVRAETLTGSPLLTDEQRTSLRSRNVQLDRRTQQVSVNPASLSSLHRH